MTSFALCLCLCLRCVFVFVFVVVVVFVFVFGRAYRVLEVLRPLLKSTNAEVQHIMMCVDIHNGDLKRILLSVSKHHGVNSFHALFGYLRLRIKALFVTDCGNSTSLVHSHPPSPFSIIMDPHHLCICILLRKRYHQKVTKSCTTGCLMSRFLISLNEVPDRAAASVSLSCPRLYVLSSFFLLSFFSSHFTHFTSLMYSPSQTNKLISTLATGTSEVKLPTISPHAEAPGMLFSHCSGRVSI